MSKIPHNWLLRIVPDAKSQFDRLASSTKDSIFHSLQQLLESETPYALPFVEKLEARKFDNLRKFRAGNYRVFFFIQQVEQAEFKGMLVVVSIRHRGKAY